MSTAKPAPPTVAKQLVPPVTKSHTSVVRLSDQWYVAARSRSLGKAPLARTILGIPMVLFRTDSGAPATLLDRCAHRNIPLSDGKVAGEHIQCSYHGWEFDRGGVCRVVPGLCADLDTGRGKRVPAFATLEQDGYIWVYATADVAPESEPFRFPEVDPRRYTTVRREVTARGTLHATLENALDVPHTAFLHGGLFRSSKTRNEITAELRRWHDRAEVHYVGEPRPSGLVAKLLSPSGGVVTHYDRFFLPCVAQVEYAIGDENHFLVTSACTPVSDFETQLFATINYRLRIPNWLVRPFLEPIAKKIFSQDAKVLAQQTDAIQRFGGEQFESTEIDLLGPHIYRILKQAERGDSKASDAPDYEKDHPADGMSEETPTQPAKTKPKARLQQGSLVDGRVSALSHDGDARGALDGGHGDVRITGGVPGDVGVFRVVHVGKNAVWAKPQELTTPSPDRVEPPCAVIHRCGGCPWQMVRREMQIATREAQLREVLGALGQQGRWHPTVQTGAATGYRTRALMMTRHLDGVLRLGFYEPRSNRLVAAEGCVVQHPVVNSALDEVRKRLDRSGLSTWRDAERPGLLRALLLRLDPDIGEGILTIVTSHPEKRLDAMAQKLLDIDGICGVHLSENSGAGGQVVGDRTHHLAGARRQTFEFGDLRLLVGPAGFVQTHHGIARELVKTVRALAPEQLGTILDLYAGVGVFGLALRQRAERVVLVEANPSACRDARANASRLPGVDHVVVRQGDAAKIGASELAALADSGKPPGLVILDPPRAGCASALIEALTKHPARSIIYISCGPQSLARDLSRLIATGYRLDDVVPFEMFPHTPHHEVLVKLSMPTTAQVDPGTPDIDQGASEARGA